MKLTPQFRIDRARDVCLLAILLHQRGFTTLSLQNEPLRAIFDGETSIFNRQAAETPEAVPTLAQLGIVVANFVRPYIFGDWDIQLQDEGSLSNKAGDTWYLETAQRLSLPLITSDGTEGNARNPKSLINRCKAEGVPVFTPLEYYLDNQRVARADLEWFLEQYVEQVPRFLDEKIPAADQEWWREWLHEVGGYLYTGIFNSARPIG